MEFILIISLRSSSPRRQQTENEEEEEEKSLFYLFFHFRYGMQATHFSTTTLRSFTREERVFICQ